MAGETDTLTIRAEMLSDIPEKAAQDAESIKAMSDAIKASSTDVVTAIGQLGDRIDTTHQRTQAAATGSTKLKKAYDDLYESGNQLKEGISGVGDSIHYRLQYPLQQLSYMLEAAGAGMVTFGLVTASSLQQGSLALGNFTGSTQLAVAAVAQLRSMQGPVGLAQLLSAYETLGQSGMGPSQVMSTLSGLTGISAVSLNPNGTMQSLAAALGQMQSTNLITTSDVQSFSTAGVDIWGLLARETGETPTELRMRFLRAGTPMQVPANFMSDLMSTPGATGGKASYDKTWAGQLENTKKAVGDLLAVVEQPLGNALASAGSKIDSWAQGTETRMKQLGPTISADWKSGNMSGLSQTLANVVGDPKLAGDIDIVVTSIHGLVKITENSLIPMGKDVMAIATPALHGLADVLDLMGQHRTTTEAVIGTLGGLIILSKVAKWTQDANTAIRAFSTILESQGLLSALAAYARGLSGLAAAQEAVTTTATDEAAAESLASGAGGLGGLGGLAGKFGGAAVAAGGGYLAYQGATSKRLTFGSGAETIGGSAAAGAGIGSIVPFIGTGVGALAGGAFGLGDVIGRAIGGAKSGATNIRQVNITVPGAGNPTKVANAIPKALNAQIVAQQQMATRRGAS